jgi:hypothetical protein
LSRGESRELPVQDCDAVSDHPSLKLAMRLQGLLASHSWVSYFKETQHAPYLLACAAHLYYPWLRAHAINVMNHTLRGENFSFLIPWVTPCCKFKNMFS